MTDKQAYKKARALYGKNAVVEHRKSGWYGVGILWMGMAVMIKGSGPSWEAAFENAKSREGDEGWEK
jgi:hypothetical protein